MRACKIAFLCIVVLAAVALPAAAQDVSYEDAAQKVARLALDLEDMFRRSSLDFGEYDAWFKSTKGVTDRFIRDFAQSHGKKESFKKIQEGLQEMGSVWVALKQAKYAEDEYKETITTGDVGYAHKWKGEAASQRKKALERIPYAIDAFQKAKEALASGN